MTLVLAGISVLLLAGIAFFWMKSRGNTRAKLPPPPATTRPVGASGTASAPAAPRPAVAEPDTPVVVPPRELPPELSGFQWARMDSLSDEQRLALLERLRQIPRPSKSLHKLVSPEFIHSASSIELSELVLGEPHIAAKVLATVNSPLYGLQRPVVSIGQGVTFLGLNTVRGLCLQYMLNESFKPAQPEVKKLFDTLWGASALASELCHRLAQKLHVPDAGAMVTQVVLSFLGHLAALSLLPPEQALASSQHTLLERLRTQQSQLGLNAVEIGHLLMQDWALPDSIVNEVVAIDGVLVTPTGPNADLHETRLALCYLCARLGEKLAFGSVLDLASYNPLEDDSVDLLHLQTHLLSPRLHQVTEMLHAPDVCNALNQMASSLRAA